MLFWIRESVTHVDEGENGHLSDPDSISGTSTKLHKYSNTRIHMRVTYDPDANAAHIYIVESIEPSEACSQEIVGDDIVLDYDDKGKLLGVEILNARRLLRTEVLFKAKRMIADLDEQEPA